jgi:hypothetical protein
VFDLRVRNGELFVAGTFSYAGAPQYTEGAVAALHVARWNGTSWLPLGSGTDNAVATLHEHDFGGSSELVIGGWFEMAGGVPNGHYARWGPDCPLGDVSGDGLVNITDFLELLAAWGPCASPCPPACNADLTADCLVGINDLLVLLSNWTG